MDNVAANPDAKSGIYDDKDRRFVGLMSDREIAEETLTILRRHDDLIMGIVGDLQSGKINPMQAMMGLFKR